MLLVTLLLLLLRWQQQGVRKLSTDGRKPKEDIQTRQPSSELPATLLLLFVLAPCFVDSYNPLHIWWSGMDCTFKRLHTPLILADKSVDVLNSNSLLMSSNAMVQ